MADQRRSGWARAGLWGCAALCGGGAAMIAAGNWLGGLSLTGLGVLACLGYADWLDTRKPR